MLPVQAEMSKWRLLYLMGREAPVFVQVFAMHFLWCCLFLLCRRRRTISVMCLSSGWRKDRAMLLYYPVFVYFVLCVGCYFVCYGGNRKKLGQLLEALVIFIMAIAITRQERWPKASHKPSFCVWPCEHGHSHSVFMLLPCWPYRIQMSVNMIIILVLCTHEWSLAPRHHWFSGIRARNVLMNNIFIHCDIDHNLCTQRMLC